MKTIGPPSCHHNDFVTTDALGHIIHHLFILQKKDNNKQIQWDKNK